MKGLRRFIPPFAPDQSGAAAVFCDLGGMVIILDAGGCAGNICGFDEPRWFGSRSAIFSAGLRDMDAILGRDDLLVKKVEKAAKRIRAKFIAIIGTPVPAVIATDYRALKRILKKKTGLPVLTVDTNGTEVYDVGAQKAWMALVKTFVNGKNQGSGEIKDMRVPDKTAPPKVGIFGMTPLELGRQPRILVSHFQKIIDQCPEWEEWTGGGSPAFQLYGMGAPIEMMDEAAGNRLNIAASPSGLAAVRYLRETRGTPFLADCPVEILKEGAALMNRESFWEDYENILIVHQQIYGNALRAEIEKRAKARVTVASWFMMDKALAREEDRQITEEDAWQDLIRKKKYDLILGDSLFAEAAGDFRGSWIDLPHFAVSGKR